MIGEQPLAAVYEVGEMVTGACAILDDDGRNLSASYVHIYVYSVDLSTRPETVVLLDHWIIHRDRPSFEHHIEVPTDVLDPGYYDIYLSFPDGSSETLRIEIIRATL